MPLILSPLLPTSAPPSSPFLQNQNSTSNVLPIKLKLTVEMAGNIIPAIATTNAIVAGLCVLQARHVLQGRLDKARMVFISRRPDQAFVTEPLRPPNPACQVCGIVRAELKCPSSTTLEQLIDGFREKLGYGEEIALIDDGGRLLYDVDFDELLDREMKDVGLIDGRTLTVVDEETDKVNVEFFITEDGDELKIPDLAEIPKKTPATNEEVNGVENGVAGKKRAREEEEDDIGFRKKAKVAAGSNGIQDTIVIDVDDDTVMID